MGNSHFSQEEICLELTNSVGGVLPPENSKCQDCKRVADVSSISIVAGNEPANMRSWPDFFPLETFVIERLFVFISENATPNWRGAVRLFIGDIGRVSRTEGDGVGISNKKF